MDNKDMPAMPFEGGSNNDMQPCIGLTKREYFAAMAMQSLICTVDWHSIEIFEEGEECELGKLKKRAYLAADAMLENGNDK